MMARTRSWCRGLLPEGDVLRLLAADLRVTTFDTHALLRRHGRDVAGAFEITDPSGASPRQPGLAPYSTKSLTDHVAEVASGELPLGVWEDSELSLAGVPNKLLLVRTESGWARPLHGYPSTHLLKTDHAVHRGGVDAEHAALAFARQIGLSAAESEVVTLGDVRCVIVNRFDRMQRLGAVDRLHQEDLLQALGLRARRGRMKYQRVGTEPPSLWHLADLLKRFGSEEDLIVLLTYVVFNTLIGNVDAHAKNFSVMIHDEGSIRIAPLYDTVPMLLWPSLQDRNALWVGNEPSISVHRRQLLSVVARSGAFPPPRRHRGGPPRTGTAAMATIVNRRARGQKMHRRKCTRNSRRRDAYMHESRMLS